MNIDCRGKLCPAPLIMTKKAIKEASTGELIEVVVDNDIACDNLSKYLNELNIVFTEQTREDGLHVIEFINKGYSVAPVNGNIGYCSVEYAQQRRYVVVMKSDKMGCGDDALGSMLMKSFLTSLEQTDILPEYIVIYNSGVFLTLKDTSTLDSLILLKQKGVKIIVCGTCLDFYQLKERFGVGEISNMFKITNILSSTDYVVYP